MSAAIFAYPVDVFHMSNQRSYS